MERSKLQELGQFADSNEINAIMQFHFVNINKEISDLQNLLGPIEAWSSSLRNAYNILLNSCSPMFLVWDYDSSQNGHRKYILLYSNPFLSLLKNTESLSIFEQSALESLVIFWDRIKLCIEKTFETRSPLQHKEVFLEEENESTSRYFYNFSFTPIGDQTDLVTGIFVTLSKEFVNADKSISKNHNWQYCELNKQFLNQLDARLRQLTDPQAILWETASSLGEYLQVSRCTFVEIDWQQGLAIVERDWCRDVPSIAGCCSISDFVIPEFQATLASGQVAIVHDVTVDPRTAPFLRNYEQFQTQAFADAPCIYQGNWVADLTVSSKTPRIWREDEISLLRETITRVWPLIEQTRAIQALRKSEAALCQSEEKLRMAITAARMIAWTWNASTNQIIRSDTARDILGISPEALIESGDQGWEMVHPDDLPMHQAKVAEAIATRSGYISEFRIIRPDNHRTIWVEDRGQVTCDAQGNLISIEGILFDITVRRQSENALRHSEEQAQLAIKVGRLGTWRYQIDSGFVELDERMREIWGEPKEAEIIPLSRILERIHPDDREQVTAAIDLALSPGSSGTYEIDYRIIWDDSTERWISANGQVRFEGEGENQQPIDFIGTALDITERKQTESMIRTSETQLRLLTDSLPVLISYVDHQRYYRFVNRVYTNWFGLLPTDIIGKHVKDVVGQEAYEAICPDIDAVLSGQRVSSEKYILFKTVGWRYVQRYFVPDIGEDGIVKGYYALINDVTEYRQAENQLRESERRLQLAQQVGKIGTWEWDFGTNFVSWSDGIWALLGLEPGSITPSLESFVQFFPSEEREMILHRVEVALSQGDDYYDEFRVIRHDGTLGWLLSKGRIIRDPDGKPIRMLGINVDITERKQAEIEREQLLIREKTAREEAERANRIKDEFLAVLSHELRSPLNPILGWASLLQTRKFDESKTKQALETIERNARLQTQLIDDLLDVSRILRGKLVLNICPINLATVIDAALETVWLSAEAKSIVIHKVVADNVGQVSGDAGRLQQVVWNLLSNAIKFTPNGGQVEVCLAQIGNEAQLQIRDTGKGISLEFLPYVFDYFRQEDGTTTRKFGGLGLGLAIVRHLTELHGGTVKVESPGEGLGATFTVLLPISKIWSRRNSTEIEFSSLAEATLPLVNLKILVVDDEMDMRELIFTILEQAGAEVKMATSATHALELLNFFKPDLIISDIGMPEVDGYTLMRQIRNLPSQQNSRITAIALTAYAAEIDQQQALAAGFQMHIAKPVKPEELVKAIIQIAVLQ